MLFFFFFGNLIEDSAMENLQQENVSLMRVIDLQNDKIRRIEGKTMEQGNPSVVSDDVIGWVDQLDSLVEKLVVQTRKI